jgi:hypothetical protein
MAIELLGDGRPLLLVDYALDFAARGWPVFPVHYPMPAGCSCGNPRCGQVAKHPITPNGLKDATTNEKQIRAWWRRHPAANIGLVTGAASGLLVLDLDNAGAIDEASRRGIPPTPYSQTAKGLHVLLKHPSGTIKNRVRLLPGMDIRADDGYIVAPPSVHATGVVYKWEVSPDEQKLADVPAWLLDLLNDKTPTPAPPAPVSRNLPTHDAGAAALFDQQIARLRTAPEGARNDTLNRAAYTLGGLVGANRLNPDDVATTLESEGRAAGLTERETLATVASGLLAGMAAPLPSRDRPPLRVFPPGQPQPAEEPTEEPAHPSQPAEEPRRSRFNLVRATEFKNRPAPDCLVEGILQVDSLAALVGPWGSYKSFIALDLSASVATGAALA